MSFKHGANGYYKHRCKCDVCTAGARIIRNRSKAKMEGWGVKVDPEPLIVLMMEQPSWREHKTRRLFARWRLQGLSVFEADRVCCRYGVHPALLWPYEFYAMVPCE